MSIFTPFFTTSGFHFTFSKHTGKPNQNWGQNLRLKTIHKQSPCKIWKVIRKTDSRVKPNELHYVTKQGSLHLLMGVPICQETY